MQPRTDAHRAQRGRMTSSDRVRTSAATVLSACIAALVLACIAGLGLARSAAAQQRVPFANGAPVAPTGLADQPLGDGPFEYRTAEQHAVRVRVLTRSLEYPYSLAFLPSGELLVTERTGRLRIVRDGVLDPAPVAGGP